MLTAGARSFCAFCCCRFPAGPWAAILQEFRADGCSRNRVPGFSPAALPCLPQLRRLSWKWNAKLLLTEARVLLQRAPMLQTLWLFDGAEYATAPARKALAAAGVTVVVA